MNESEYSQIYLIEKANQTYVVHKPIQTDVLYPNIMSNYNQLQFNDCYYQYFHKDPIKSIKLQMSSAPV
jgi:hypothetical protein